MYNRKQRREMEKQLGLFKELKKMSESQKTEIRNRKNATGQQIHLQNIQELENQKVQAEADSYARVVQGLIDSGKTLEEAEEIAKRNIENENARRTKLAERAERQKAKAQGRPIAKK
jgi:hypothetical protein